MTRPMLWTFAAGVSGIASTWTLAESKRLPPMGFNSWTAFGCGVTQDDLYRTADFFVASNLSAAGYRIVTTDDCWHAETRDASGRLQPDPVRFSKGIPALASYMAAKGLELGIYSSASSVVCSGRPGSLFHEIIDAQTFADWGVSYFKYDNCGEYGYGDSRYEVMSDALNATGKRIFLSTEPFQLVPTPRLSGLVDMYRCCNDINSQWSTILDRIDRNEKFGPMVAATNTLSDPDMLQVGNGQLTPAEQRAHFGLWALAKAPLILGTDVTKLTPAQVQLLSNPDVIAVNQDPLVIPARKLAVNGTAPPRFVGLGPCDAAASTTLGVNGVFGPALTWAVQALPGTVNGSTAYSVTNANTGKCLGVGSYAGSANVPLLFTCNASDMSQAWLLPTGLGRVGAILSVAAGGATAGAVSALAVSNTTLYGTIHGKDPIPLLDSAYGITQLGLNAYQPEAPCGNRNCQDYSPEQSWYISPRSGLISLALFTANAYRTFAGPGYVLTDKLPASQQLCLSHVLSIANEGTDPSTTTVPGVDVWGGPLEGGAFAVGLFNRMASAAPVTARWSWLDVPGVGDATVFCVRELFNGTSLGAATGGIELPVGSHDLALLRLTPPGAGGGC